MIKAIACTALFSAVLYLGYGVFARPILYKSYSTGHCAFIELANGERVGCEYYQPGKRYLFAWVK